MNTEDPLRSLASALVAKACCHLNPNFILTLLSSTEEGFLVQGKMAAAPKEGFQEQLEEAIRKELQSDEELQWMNLLPKNGAEFLRDHGQPILAEQARGTKSEDLSIVRIEDFGAPCPKSETNIARDVGVIEIFSINSKPFEREGFIVEITGARFPSQKELKEYQKKWKVHAPFDHRIYGPEHGFFRFTEKGEVLWLPKGAALCQLFTRWWNEWMSWRGYLPAKSSLVVPAEYRKWIDRGMSSACPMIPLMHGIVAMQEMRDGLYEVVAVSQNMSRRAKIGAFHTEESTQAYATYFCFPDQAKSELISSLQLIDKISRIFGFNCEWELASESFPNGLSRKDGKRLNHLLLEAMKLTEIPHEKCGDLSDSAPVAKLKWIDFLGREWTLGEVGLERIQKGTDTKTLKEPVLCIWQSFFGSFERFTALLIEYYRGEWPIFLAPVQVSVLSTDENVANYADRVTKKLKLGGLRVELNDSSDELRLKVKQAKQHKIPVIVVVGAEEEQITVRKGPNELENQKTSIENLIDLIKKEEIEVMEKIYLENKE